MPRAADELLAGDDDVVVRMDADDEAAVRGRRVQSVVHCLRPEAARGGLDVQPVFIAQTRPLFAAAGFSRSFIAAAHSSISLGSQA